ncbi:MAG: hypothetical protein AB2693_20495, partial [Candidatus Thiodiazotropha sp.]
NCALSYRCNRCDLNSVLSPCFLENCRNAAALRFTALYVLAASFVAIKQYISSTDILANLLFAILQG